MSTAVIEPFTLLALPDEVICKIVWDHIAPWERAPLSETCHLLHNISHDAIYGEPIIGPSSFYSPFATEALWAWLRVRVLAESGKENVMQMAALNGNEAAVVMCHDTWGATGVDMALKCAAFGGSDAITRLCHDVYGVGARAKAYAMWAAAKNGHEALVRSMYAEWEVDDENAEGIMQELYPNAPINENLAAEARKAEAVMRVDQAYTNGVLRAAAGGGHVGIVRLACDEWGAADKRSSMAIAAASGQLGVVRLFHDVYGVTGVAAITAAMDKALEGSAPEHAPEPVIDPEPKPERDNRWGSSDALCVADGAAVVVKGDHDATVAQCRAWLGDAI